MNNLRNLSALLLANNGFSYSINTGETNPDTGFMVSLKGHERKISLPLSVGEIEEQIKSFALDYSTCLANEYAFLGGWIDNNSLYLDVSKKLTFESEAYRLAVKNNQIAYFNNATGKTVFVKDKELKSVSTLEDLIQSILSASKQVIFKGEVVTLPSPQKSGTMQQNRDYAYIKAKEFFYGK